MREHIILGNTPLAVTDQDFSAGYQEGYQRYITHYQNKPLTDEDVYGFLARNIYDTMKTGRYRAGYIVGWCAALHGQCQSRATVVYPIATTQQQVQVTV